MIVISAETAEHYVWGNGCDGWHRIRSPGCSVIQERLPRQFFNELLEQRTVRMLNSSYLVGKESYQVPYKPKPTSSPPPKK
jgi:hypothetical protein